MKTLHLLPLRSGMGLPCLILAFTLTACGGGGGSTATPQPTGGGGGTTTPPAQQRGQADADGDGLIEIGTLADLNNVRHNLAGTSYRTGPSATPNTSGCPARGCSGYELTANLNFDRDGDGNTWVRNNDGSFTLDAGDSHPDYFDTAAGGWVPIGGDSPFTAIFDGGGHTISGLATVRSLAFIGLFSAIGADADIRNLGLVDNLAKSTGTSLNIQVGGLAGSTIGTIAASYATGRVEGGDGLTGLVGGLVGFQGVGGAITASHATGDVDGGSGTDFVGGLAGSTLGTIAASYATGRVDGGADGDHVGGLVGSQVGGIITASHATGRVDGGAGDDSVGGLVGSQTGGESNTIIAASYATGRVDGGAGDDSVGGLVGVQILRGTIVASYATGRFDGSGFAGALVGVHVEDDLSGIQLGNVITASWGFGRAVGEDDGFAGSSDRPNGVTSATGLTSANVPSAWNRASSNTLGAWDFGTTRQLPVLRYADYDGTGGSRFRCGTIIPNCGSLIPGQVRTVSGVSGGGGTIGAIIQAGPASTSYRVQQVAISAQISAGYHRANSVSGNMNDGISANDADANKGATQQTTQADASQAANLIATFDDATQDLTDIRVDAARYSLTGIFANPTLANWNRFDGQADAAHVGDASVSTWQIGTLMEAQATGSIRINGVAISGDYINFLIAGGGDGADVGVSLYVSGTGIVLATYTPNFCADRYLKGDQHWAHFDVSALAGTVVDIEIHDRDAANDCGFIAFDHFYQSGGAQGKLAGTADQSALR